MTTDALQPPVAHREPFSRTHHGDTVEDPYEWLRDKDDPRTNAHLEAENAYTQQQTAHLEELRGTIFTEIKNRTQETDMSVPVRHGAWWYYVRTVAGAQYSLSCRAPAGDSWEPPVTDGPLLGEEVVLDSNAEAEGHEFFSVGAFSLSDDGTQLAWSSDTRGDERYDLVVKDLRTGQTLPDRITGVSPGATWSADGRHLFYTRVDDAWRPFQVWRHVLGADTEDELVFQEDDPRYFVGVGRTNSEAFLVLHIGSKVTTEIRLLSADDPTGEFRTVLPRIEGVEYSVEHLRLAGRDHLAILHNRHHPNFQLDLAPVEDPTAARTIVTADDTTRLDDVEAFADHLALSYRRDALTRIALIDLDHDTAALGPVREIDFGETLFSAGFGANAEWDPPYIRVGVTSYVRPASIFDLRLDTGELVLRKQATVLGDYDPADYEQHRAWVEAEDGTLVPLSIVCRVGTPRDGTAPALLYGYGSYEASMDPGFSIARLSLLDRGFVYAVAHVRGGGEMGRHWYENGKMSNKRNTFTDFIACARHLVAEQWTSADRLVAEGGSAGGLLMGAVSNMAPESFAGILAEVPFVDPLTSILDPDLPLTVIEWDEWGNPLHDPEAYAYIKSYAPYDNVTRQQYPSILAVTSLNDTRVLYVEPAKWVARLRAESGTTNPVLLKTEMSAGHGGVSGRYAAWEERAFELAWIIDTAGAFPRSS